MKSVILYSTLDRDSGTNDSGYWPVKTMSGRVVYVRAELFDGNVLDALNAANPREGETVLNSIPVEDQ